MDVYDRREFCNELPQRPHTRADRRSCRADAVRR